ncbi:hypothetical protein AVEN_18575-1 [Araneus ventricosus]|uniref:Uncharacterized protein n=1 Tax=Araneus ventricosus TaxID=182803 RepID=A0A4Y2UHS0_ARAVE|nr:hypothetical protein AVEN_18575-1 [Araneus ventricosus]
MSRLWNTLYEGKHIVLLQTDGQNVKRRFNKLSMFPNSLPSLREKLHDIEGASVAMQIHKSNKIAFIGLYFSVGRIPQDTSGIDDGRIDELSNNMFFARVLSAAVILAMKCSAESTEVSQARLLR